MVVTDIGKSFVAIRLGSNIPVPEYLAIGSGSGAVLSTDVILVAETDRNAFSTTSFATARKYNFTADFNSVELSGTALREFGITHSGAADTGSMWQREGFTAITFDGTNELKFDVTWEIF